MKNLFVLFFWIILIFIFLFLNRLNETFIDNKKTIYNFNTSWCEYSIKFQPIWKKFVKTLLPKDNIVSIDAQCDNNKYDLLQSKFGVEGYPTIVITENNSFIKYTGPSTVNGLRTALNLSEINDNIKTSDFMNNIKLYNFNTSWCGHCVQFQPIWENFVKLNNNINVETFDIKCDDDKNADLCKKYNILGFPSVLKEDSNGVTLYDGPRTEAGLINFIN